ncbi:MAG: hypothetical protein WBV73_18795 [Phormidium sp.]
MTKFQLFLTTFSLFSLTTLAGNSYAQLKSNQPTLQAQGTTTTTAPSCPLPESIAVTFLRSECRQVQLKEPKTYYRYYSNDGNKFGRYLTTNRYNKNVEVIRNLALKQEWGNQATIMLQVTVPAGTKVYEGIVAPQDPQSCYRGGAQQTFIEDSKDPKLKWSSGTPMQVEAFKCP